MKQGPEKPRDRFEGLTNEERKWLKDLEKIVSMGGTLEDKEMARVFVEHQRISIVLVRSMEELQETNKALYIRFALAVKEHPDSLTDLLNAVLDPTERDEPSIEVQNPDGILNTDILMTAGFRMRAILIEHFANTPSMQNIVRLLRDLQVLLPEVSQG